MWELGRHRRWNKHTIQRYDGEIVSLTCTRRLVQRNIEPDSKLRLPQTALVVHLSLRVSYGQDLEIAECFVFLLVVYGEGTFKLVDKYL